jgi:hypothetical protein
VSSARKGVTLSSSWLVCAGQAALEDLTATPQSTRQALIVAHRLSAWRLPPSVAADLNTQQVALSCGTLGTAPHCAAATPWRQLCTALPGSCRQQSAVLLHSGHNCSIM